MNASGTYQDIPKTGRIGRFARFVEKKTNLEAYHRIMKNAPGYNQLKADQKAIWWKEAVERMEKELGIEQSGEVMRACGEKCCGKGSRELALKLMEESGSIENFLHKLSHYKVKEGDLEFTLIDEHTIRGRYNKCFCGQVRETPGAFAGKTYCQCSVAYNKQFFGAALNKPVEVRLNKSIISGDDYCEFEVDF